MSTPGRGRRIAAWILTGILGALFVMSAVMKLAGAQPVMESFAKWGLEHKAFLIGLGELISALLFILPRTHSIGVLLLSAYMGGAIATHMQHNEPYVFASLFLLVVWVTAYLRHPEVLHSLHGHRG